MTTGQKIATVTTTSAGAAAVTVGSIVVSNSTPASFTPDEVFSEAEDLADEETESTYIPLHNPQPLTLQQANPHYQEINNWLKDGKKLQINYKNTIPPTFSSVPDKYLEPNDRYRFGDYANAKSFLRVSTTKNTYSSGKWSGSLSWYWSFTNTRKDRGFITFNKAETTNDKRLRLTGVFYVLERNPELGVWDIKYHKQVGYEDKKLLDKDNFDQYFPKPNWYTQEGKFDEVYYTNWNFMDGYWDLENTCEFSTTDCRGTPSEPITWTGNYVYEGGPWYEDGNCDHWYYRKWCDKMYMWSSNSTQFRGLYWYDYMYGKDNKYDLRYFIGFYYRGRWRKVG